LTQISAGPRSSPAPANAQRRAVASPPQPNAAAGRL